MNLFAPGSLLAQTAPSSTTAATAFVATVRTEITRVEVCNVTGSPATYRLYHDDAAAGFAVGNALRYDKSVGTGDVDTPLAAFPGSGWTIKAGGVVGVRSSAGSALTFSFYGVTAPQR